MMKKTVVINVVGLSRRVLGNHTPFLKKRSEDGQITTIHPAFPAVTCSAQANYLTGVYPETHGIVGNGWYFDEECEIKFWKQSNKLVQAKKIWEVMKQEDPSFTCANLFWWYNMYSSVDISVTPRPQYAADGRKLPDVYSHPAGLRDKLQKKLGTFPLFNFWGPASSIKSSQWIAEAAKAVEEDHSPTLSLIYLPHLDYNLQKYGPSHPYVVNDFKSIDKICEDLVSFYEKRGARVIILSEYGISEVAHPVHLNRVLRSHGLISVRTESGGELLDPGASGAFAVADHQIAHVYVNDKSRLSKVRAILENTDGVEQVLGAEEKSAYRIDHARSGDFVVIAKEGYWFSYYYWMDDLRAPDFARIVEIHRKPGYDPAELFFDPGIRMLYPTLAYKLLSKKLGFRTLMDVIPLDATLVKGSHGRPSPDGQDLPVLILPDKGAVKAESIESTDVFHLIRSSLTGSKISMNGLLKESQSSAHAVKLQ